MPTYSLSSELIWGAFQTKHLLTDKRPQSCPIHEGTTRDNQQTRGRLAPEPSCQLSGDLGLLWTWYCKGWRAELGTQLV